MYYIYKMIHPQSGRVYIGQHKAKRGCIDYAKDGYNGSGAIWKKIHKKHADECVKVILDFAETKDEIDALEIKYIAHYKAVWGDYCVNIAIGGKIGGTPKRFTDEELRQHRRAQKKRYCEQHPEYKSAKDKRHYQRHREERLAYQYKYQQENKEKVRARAKRYKDKQKLIKSYQWNDEQRAAACERNSGENNGFYGKRHTEETRLKMRQAWERRRAKKQAEKDKNKP